MKTLSAVDTERVVDRLADRIAKAEKETLGKTVDDFETKRLVKMFDRV